MTITPQEALQRTIEHREIFHDEMVGLMRQVMRGDVSPVMTAAIEAMIGPSPISRAICAPMMENTISPSASSTRNSRRRCGITGAAMVVRTAATATMMTYSGCFTQPRG